MEWKYLKETYREVLNNQIMTDPVQETIDVYNQLLENGYDETQAIDKMTIYMHEYFIENIKANKVDEKKWIEKIEPLKKDIINDLEYIDQRKLNRMLKTVKKEFGSIKHSQEMLYEEGLNAFESNLYKQSQSYGLNSRQIKKIVQAWMIKLYGLYYDTDYDLSYTIDEDLIEMTKPLVYNCNPYINEELKVQFLKDYPDLDLNDPQTKRRNYEMNFRLLGRILESIDFWNKEYGANGYLNYLSHFMEN